MTTKPPRRSSIPEATHWYRLYLGSCPVCGSDKSYRERVYGKRPEKLEDRVVYLSDTETYDWCDT